MKKEKMLIFKLFKPILGPIYKFYYNPTVIGKENIPKDGPILLVGNHVHIMDQCNVVIATKRCIHYMAKKEYFDDKKVAWFFKSVGCIPVNRQIKDEDAKSAAMDVLNNKWALGLFPEGTRNGLKDTKITEVMEYLKVKENFDEFKEKIKDNKTSFVNYAIELEKNGVIKKKDIINNISDISGLLLKLVDDKKITMEDYYNHIMLEFKFGAVSMAKKSGGLLVPYAITGDYKFRSKNLLIRIGKPIKVDSDMDLEEANKILFESIRDLMIENLKNSGK